MGRETGPDLIRRLLEPALVRIKMANTVVVGAGFLVPQRRILTCAHVVNVALGRGENEADRPTRPVSVDFLFAAPRRTLSARVRNWVPAHSDGGGDIALLELENDVPDGAQPVQLVGAANASGHVFWACGFPDGHPGGYWTDGRIVRAQGTGLIQIEIPKLTGAAVERGFSGTAVWDHQLEGVVGMVATYDLAMERRTAFIIPTESLSEVLPETALQIAPPCPYRGLAAFAKEHRNVYFGREEAVADLSQRVARQPVTVVTAPSGAGKSSVVAAGLTPSLEDQSWHVVSLRPEREPFRSLATALLPSFEPHLNNVTSLDARDDLARHLRQGRLGEICATIAQNTGSDRMLLVVDQFEELFTLTPEPDRTPFADALLAAADRDDRARPILRLVLVVRADFLGQLVEHSGLGRLVEKYTIVLQRMDAAQLRRAIEEPAEVGGTQFEAYLVDRILRDVEKEPGNLPLLQFALTELWKRRQNRRLTHAAYAELGGVEGALAHYADSVYKRLGSADQQRTRRVLVQLVRPGEGTPDTRRLVSRAEVGPGAWAILRRLADERLVVTGEDANRQETAELAHEALINSWQLLREEIDTHRDFRSWQERLGVALRLWKQHGSQVGYLLHGPHLEEAERWIVQRPDEISVEEQDYFYASRVQANHGPNRPPGDRAANLLDAMDGWPIPSMTRPLRRLVDLVVNMERWRLSQKPRWSAVHKAAVSFWVWGLLAWYWAEHGRRTLHEIETGWSTGQPIDLGWTSEATGRWIETSLSTSLWRAAVGYLASFAAVWLLTRPVFRLLAGRWPAPLRWLLVSPQRRQLGRDRKRLEKLESTLKTGSATQRQIRECERLTWHVHREMPPELDQVQATRLGNVAAAADAWPQLTWGLDPAVCMPRLWPLLPAWIRASLEMSRNELFKSVTWWIRSASIAIWIIWTWWAIPVAVYATWRATRALRNPPVAYAEAEYVALQHHRLRLYEAMSEPVPSDLDEECAYGEALSTRLRNTGTKQLDFTRRVGF